MKERIIPCLLALTRHSLIVDACWRVYLSGSKESKIETSLFMPPRVIGSKFLTQSWRATKSTTIDAQSIS